MVGENLAQNLRKIIRRIRHERFAARFGGQGRQAVLVQLAVRVQPDCVDRVAVLLRGLHRCIQFLAGLALGAPS
ncbi:hypothetical protein D3C71_1378330 [compost metagenome]